MRSGARRGAGGLAAWICALALVAGGASPARTFTVDARRMAMGNALVPGGRDLATANVAYQAMPARRAAGRFVIPIPLGLAQLAADPPSFDPESDAFDIFRIANLALNPPFFMEMSTPSLLDGDIAISIAREAMSIDFQDAHDLLPQEPLRMGSLYSRPVVGLGLLGARTYLAPWLQVEGRMRLDDALYGVLSQGAPLLPNSRYEFSTDAATAGGASLNVGYADGGWGREDGDGIYLGAYAKYLLGCGLGMADARIGLATADTIFGDRDPLDVTYEAWTRTSRLGRLGSGVGFDAGIAYRRGPFDLGLGCRDLASSVTWGATQLDHSYLEDSTGAIVTETVASGEHYTLSLPLQTTVNLAWSGTRTTLAADLSTSRWGTLVHLGAEERLGRFALRGGVRTDERDALQYACGVGIGFARVWFDVALQTHGFALTGERGLVLGTSVAIR